MTLEELRAAIAAESQVPGDCVFVRKSIALALIDVAEAAEDWKANDRPYSVLFDRLSALDTALAAQEKT